MMRVLLTMMLVGASFAGFAADDPRVSRLEQHVRDLQREVRSLARQIEELRSQPARTDIRPQSPPASPGAPAAAGEWVDAGKWQRLRAGMSELEVIALLGAPTSMRSHDGERVLFYAMEIGASGFLGGSVTLRDRVVAEVQQPVLR